MKHFLEPFLGIQVILAAVLVMSLYILPGPFYYFWWGLFGGYDKNTLKNFEMAVELAGPSRFIVKPWYSLAKKGSQLSSLFGRFPVDYEKVAKEINELMGQKQDVDRLVG